MSSYVYYVLKSINTRKGCGPDGVQPRLLKEAAHVLVRPIQTLFNNNMAQGKLPDLRKLSNIKPIPKCKPANNPKDYRPIALTSVIVKCLERLLVKYFKPLVKDPNQFTYGQHWSTEDTVMLTLDSLTGYLILIH